MKIYRSGGETRLWFADLAEIDAIAEDELAKATLTPTAESPMVDIEVFVERHLKATLDQYAVLEPDVLGLTRFVSDSPPEIEISRDLTGSALDSEVPEAGRLGRWRATVAHEAGHVLLHQQLFDASVQQSVMFVHEEQPSPRLLRCLKRNVSYGYGGNDWREIQANRAMGALLMPRTFFSQIARQQLISVSGDAASAEAGSSRATSLTRQMANRCGVSKQAASIRLQTLGFLHPAGSTPLPLA